MSARCPRVTWRTRAMVCIGLAAGLLGAAGAGGTLGVPLPPGTQVEWVIEDGRIAGQRVSLQRFLTAARPEALREALMPAAGEGHQSSRSFNAQSGAWQVLTTRGDDGYRTLQWRGLPDGRTEALLTHWSGPHRSASPLVDPVALLPPGASVLRRFSVRDGGHRNETLVAWSREPVAQFAAHLHERLIASGLHAGPAPNAPAGSVARFYRGRGVELALTVTPHAGRSALVLHHSEVSP